MPPTFLALKYLQDVNKTMKQNNVFHVFQRICKIIIKTKTSGQGIIPSGNIIIASVSCLVTNDWQFFDGKYFGN
jgi:hypothetical protein